MEYVLCMHVGGGGGCAFPTLQPVQDQAGEDVFNGRQLTDTGRFPACE
jgi:hypothetical protein